MSEFARHYAAQRKEPAAEPEQPRAKKPRKPLQQMSAKRKALLRILGPERRELKERTGCCIRCLTKLPPDYLDAHEIANGAAREACLSEPLLVLVLCRECHDDVGSWPPAKQIALQIQWLMETACERYCELKGLKPTAVVAGEVVAFLMYQKAIQASKPEEEA